jgi:single-stranded-DNA-specific exonuclease
MTPEAPPSDGVHHAVENIRSAVNCQAVIAAILVRRGIDTPEKARLFLDCPLAALRDPMRMHGMPAAVSRLTAAARDREKILVFGDYDADGVCATGVLMEFFRDSGIPAVHYIPHRITEGYGFHPAALENGAVPEGTRLIVTVDCGISSHAAVFAARRRGIDVIITDHHDPGETIPEAAAVINPKLAACTAGLHHLSGAGVAYYLAIAVRTGLRSIDYWSQRRPEPNMLAYIDLVAIGTVADMVPLIHENRVLVRTGLKALRAGRRPGVAALLGKRGAGHLSGEDIAFRIAPPVNAAGRLRHADRALSLLMSRGGRDAERRARHLLQLNTRRKEVEQDIYNEAAARLSQAPVSGPMTAIVLADAGWHLGVLGIVAARLSRDHGCPAILFTKTGDSWKGSGRSPDGIDIMACLNRCSDAILSYGGHAGAAGVALTDPQLHGFSERFNAAVTTVTADTPPWADRWWMPNCRSRMLRRNLPTNWNCWSPSAKAIPNPPSPVGTCVWCPPRGWGRGIAGSRSRLSNPPATVAARPFTSMRRNAPRRGIS